jgi:hypothetical protein
MEVSPCPSQLLNSEKKYWIFPIVSGWRCISSLYKSVDPTTLASHPEWVNALGRYTEELAALHENHALL